MWLASYPRSGNTLLRTLMWHCFGINTYSLYDDKDDIGADAELSSIVGHVRHDLDQAEFYTKAKESESTYFVKTHDPPADNAKAIYIVRDGRSAVVSYFHYIKAFNPGAATTIRDVIVGECMFGAWSDHFEAWHSRKRPHTLLLRYDDLARNPANGLDLISAFVERPIINPRPPSFEELKTVNSKFFRSGGDVTNIGELTGETLDVFWSLHGRLMVELGYVNDLQ
ncbi:MAG: sulfotransferase domain-containing protein [Methylovirgula sp.]